MTLGSNEKSLQLRIITFYVGNESFWFCGLFLNVCFSFLSRVVGVHLSVIARFWTLCQMFWTLCQMWVLELSLEELSTLATGVHNSAYLQLE